MMQWNKRYIVSMLLIALAMILFSCGGGGDEADGDVVDGDSAQPECDTDADCPIGQTCGASKTCVSQTDGDIPTDGDNNVEPTRIFRMVPDGELDFGDVEIYANPAVDVTIYNDGNSVLHLYDANWLSPQVDNPWTLQNYREAAIQPGASFTFQIAFLARGLGSVEGQLRINNDSDNNYRADLDVLANAIPESGNAEIGSDPSAETGVVFEDIALGTRLARQTLRIGNTGPPSSEVILTSLYMQSAGMQPFEIEYREAQSSIVVTPEAPLNIGGASSVPLTVFFSPPSSGDYSDVAIIEYHTNTNDQTELYEVPVSGNAVAGGIVALPTTIDFGTIPVLDENTVDITLVNNTGDATIDILPMKISGLSNWMGVYTFSENAQGTISIPPRENFEFQLTFRPNEIADFSGELQIDTNYNGEKYFFPITAFGGEVNQKPQARIAQTPSGADIGSTLSVEVGDVKEFYGDISRDPDGNSANLTYQWTLLRPDTSVANLVPNDRSPIVTLMFDKAGNYALTLVVTDEEGAQSDPKTVNISATVAGSSIIKIEMHTRGITGDADADLGWVLPNGTTCNEDHASAAGTCLTPEGMGSVLIQSCGSASQCTIEAITHANAPQNGTFEIQVYFDRDCNDPQPLLPDCNFGLNRDDLDFDIFIYVDQVLTFQMTGESMSAEGQRKSWTITRQSGAWQPPVPR